MEHEIETLIKKHYKNTTLESVKTIGDIVIIRCKPNKVITMSYIALRILNKYPQFHSVIFTGGWTEHYYSRETLKWGSFYVKKNVKLI